MKVTFHTIDLLICVIIIQWPNNKWWLASVSFIWF
jgi:hypothetical protein